MVNVYGSENLAKLGLSNNQTITYDQRFMITRNTLHPKVYQVTKVDDTIPQGIIKMSLKQDEYNPKRDSVDMMICDYFTEEGNLKVDITTPLEPDEEATSSISCFTINDKDELEPAVDIQHLERGKALYFKVDFSAENINPEWKVSLINDGNYSADDVNYYTGLISVTKFDDLVVAIKPAKAGSLVGKKFRLSVSDINGNYYSSIDLEVI